MNNYFDSQDYTAPVANTTARASQIEAIASAVERGFDRLPSPSEIGQYVTDTGAANAYVVSLSPTPTEYTVGMTVRFKALATNTMASTLNVNSLGAKAIKKRVNEDLAASDIVAGQVVVLTYDGTYFQIVSMPGTANDNIQDAAGYATQAATSAGTATTQAGIATAAAAQVNSALYKWAGTAGGTANALTLTPAIALTSYQAGIRMTFLAANTNTGAATVNASALGAQAIKKGDGTALVAGDIIAGSIYTIVYDGTNFRLTEGERDPDAIVTPDLFNGTGAQTAFTLSFDPGSENAIDVYISGVYQQKNTFSLSGTTLTFSVAPPSGTGNIEVAFRAGQSIGNVPTDGSVTTAKIADGAVTAAKIPDGSITTAKLAAGISLSIPVSTKAITYNMLTADLGTEIKFSASSTTLNLLAAATAGNGGLVLVSNGASSGDVTIDPSGAELIDGLASRLLRPGNRVWLRCNGTGWETIAGKYTFTSADITPALSTISDQAHGLGEEPTSVRAYFRCTAIDGTWQVGDKLDFLSPNVTYGRSLGKNSTNVIVTFNQTYTYSAGNKTTGAGFALDYSKWKVVIEAEVDKG